MLDSRSWFYFGSLKVDLIVLQELDKGLWKFKLESECLVSPVFVYFKLQLFYCSELPEGTSKSLGISLDSYPSITLINFMVKF